MNFGIKNFLGVSSILLFLIITISCAPKVYRAHPELESRIKNVNIPGLLPPDVKIYELTAGGIKELRDEWSEKGKENVLRTIKENFNEKKFNIKILTIDEEIEEELEDIHALYRAVSRSVQLHTYGPFLFPEKQKNFDYSIGSIEKILQRLGSDAMIFVYGHDEISTGGRKALTALGVIAGAFTGVMIMPRSGITSMNIALVDTSGTILWYSMRISQGGHDLRNPSSVSSLLKNILSDFPSLEK